MTENELSKVIVNTCFEIHKGVGPGMFESVYEEILYFELSNLGLNIKRQVTLPIVWKNLKIDKAFVADLIIDNKVIIEVKSVEKLSPVHEKQLISYLKLSDLKLGLLVNFNESLIKNGIKRIVNGL